MAIDFRNPLANHGSLLTRLRNMIERNGPEKEPGRTTGGATGAGLGDRISLSDDARRLAGDITGNTTGQPQAAERIASLKQAIETGTFRIDSSRIADKVRLQYGGR
jgi:flagellar biosynthesis anti-sigma factor FlgM